MTKPKSGRYPWFKFNPRRWLSDIELRCCSPAARGVWADMLCAIHEADAGGHLLIAGKAPTPVQLAKLVGVSVREYQALEKELEENGVFSRRETDGAIYCRLNKRESEAEGEPEGHPKGLPDSPEGLPPRARSHSLSHSGSPERSPEGRAGPPDDADPMPPSEPSHMDAALRMHPALDLPEARKALADFEAHRASAGQRPWTAHAWERLCLDWERHQPDPVAWLVDACDTAIRANKFTPFRSSHADPPPLPATKPKAAADTPEQVDLRERWLRMEFRRVSEQTRRGVRDGVRDYPGHDQAKRDLEDRGKGAA